MLRIFAIFILGFSQLAIADENLGKTYPIKEPDMLDEIQSKLHLMEKSGAMKKLQQEAIDRSRNSMEHPDPVKGIVRTDKPRTFYFDPSVRVPRDIVTPDGKVIAHANDKINPLDYVPMSKHLVFFDQRDQDQIKIAQAIIKKYDGRVKPILVAGEPLTLTRLWKQQVYFDQSGWLVKRFGIRQVPALVSQDDKRLRIDELEVKP